MGLRCALTLIVLLSITSIHETGHALVGMMCGMKLRAFFVGPFQWRIRDGRWEFEFKPKGLILANGVTALIPGDGKLLPRQYLSMMAAGSISNVLSGSLALLIALGSGRALPVQVIGFLTLFGSWSLGLAASNLLPFRTPQGYSDGAIVLQILAEGAFAEFHLSRLADWLEPGFISPATGLRYRLHPPGGMQDCPRTPGSHDVALCLQPLH